MNIQTNNRINGNGHSKTMTIKMKILRTKKTNKYRREKRKKNAQQV